jgi:site-specific DNA-methyltransferase (adenine-specific)
VPTANTFENRIVRGDCLDVLSDLPDSCIDLAYLDPPFNTGRSFSGARGSYEDRWDGLADYLRYLQPRIETVHRLLKPTGSILLHCDWRACHHLRLLLDAVFGDSCFVNHLIWSYGLGGSSPRRFSRKHDDILFYGRTQAYWFEPPMVEARSQRMRGMRKKATDVLDIPAINNMADERAGYPTQKPLELLEMLVCACCPPNGTVLDPFCGSGTTLVAASRHERRYLGIDINPEAVMISQSRVAPTIEPAPC